MKTRRGRLKATALAALAAGVLIGCATVDSATTSAPADPPAPAFERAGFYTELDKDGRLWVFKDGSTELAEFKAKGKPARHVVRPAAGPGGVTLKAVDFETLDAYQAVR
jgi:hypothetical protein